MGVKRNGEETVYLVPLGLSRFLGSVRVPNSCSAQPSFQCRFLIFFFFLFLRVTRCFTITGFCGVSFMSLMFLRCFPFIFGSRVVSEVSIMNSAVLRCVILATWRS